MNKLHYLSAGLLFILLTYTASAQNSITAIYSLGDIPTSSFAFDSTCNGNNIVLQLSLPAGETYAVTGIDISYSMTALGSGKMEDQRSQVKCANTNITEPTSNNGRGTTTGTFVYNRTNISIANGTYAGGTVISFEMHAWRATSNVNNLGCNTIENRVNANSWQITLHYSDQPALSKVGINTTVPGQMLQVNGKLKLGDDLVSPDAGTIRWNSINKDFEGYDGTQWLSLTSKGNNNGWGSNPASNENYSFKGISANSLFGSSVGIYGTVGSNVGAISGGPELQISTNTNAGMVLTYSKISGQWQATDPIGGANAPDDTADAKYGAAVAVDNLYGRHIAVGAPGRKVGNNSAQGKAYFYYNSGDLGGGAAQVTANDGAANDFFGCSISVSGSYAVIGAYGKDVGGNINQGCAYIFQKETGSVNNWNQVAILTASDGAGSDLFGYSVSISGNYIIVGAKNKNAGGYNSQGKAYIFYRTGSAWSQQAILTAADAASGNNFGYSVSISGDYAVVGTPGKMIEGKQLVGKAYVYNRTGTTWSLQAEITASERDRFDDFGSSVSISEDNIVIGAPQGHLATDSKGKAYVFKRSGTNWYQLARLVASDGHYGDDFGTSVAINGQYIAVGAPGFDYINSSGQTFSNTGKIYFFNAQ